MQDFEGRVAVVTGAASGMGLAFSERFAREGMHVVMADIEDNALEAQVARLRQQELDVIGVRADVSAQESVDALADRAEQAFGAVHILCNNAGVMADSDLGDVEGRGEGAAPVWEQSLEQWHWTFGVNVWGVVHGLRSFVPRMLEHGEPGHIVNTASIAGLTSGALVPVYGATKHVVVRISEALYLQLQQLGAPIGVSALCPGTVNTQIAISDRNRPRELAGAEGASSEESRSERQAGWIQRSADVGMEPDRVADILFEAIRQEQFYVLPHEGMEPAIERRMRDILERRNPR